MPRLMVGLEGQKRLGERLVGFVYKRCFSRLTEEARCTLLAMPFCFLIYPELRDPIAWSCLAVMMDCTPLNHELQ